MSEVEVWIISRGVHQHRRAVEALQHMAHQPARFGLVKVEGMNSGGDTVMGRMFVVDGSPSGLPQTAVRKALDELPNETYPIPEQQIICFPLH